MGETLISAEEAPPVALLREPPHVDPSRAAHVKRILACIQKGKEHWKRDFDRMRWCMDFAAGLQWVGQSDYDDERFRVNLVARHIRLRTAALYAKNPKAVYKRKPRLDFRLWDERPESLQAAMGLVQMAQQPPMLGHNGGPPTAMPMVPPAALQQAVDLLADYQEGMAKRGTVERVGRSLELLWDRFITEPVPNVKIQMKQWVRRSLVCGVGYVKLGFQRQMAPRPDQATRIADLTSQLAAIERLRAVLSDQAGAAAEHESEELRQALIALQSEPEVVLREGPLLDFPRATALIPDPATRSLRGWVGTNWLAEEFVLPARMVQEIYGVVLGANAATEAWRTLTFGQPGVEDAEAPVRFWQFYDFPTRRVYTVSEGWPDYLEEPRAPEVNLERFFPYYALTFNDLEHEKRVFPPSDVEMLRSPQEEYNRVRESLRQHRIANRPLYVSSVGAFDKEDKKNLLEYDAHDVVVLNNLKEGQNAAELLQPVQKVPIDPNAYETGSLLTDILYSTGSQEANLGGTSGATATETSVAESSRLSVIASDIDDLDEVLTDLARDFGQVCLAEMSAEKVTEIVGPGAVWPSLSRAEIAAELELTVEAGSSGRPNRDRDLANFERAMPYLLQLPGIDPAALAKHGLKLLDDRLDVTEFLRPGTPSVVAMNAMSRPSTGNASTDPAQQGGEGSLNAPSAQVRPGGPQPAYGPSGNSVG
jgi:hypothetical protein